MANSIELFKVYLPFLDEVYQNASKTAGLESESSLLVKVNESGEFKIPKITMDGLGDYSRSAGYPEGDVTLETETKKPDYERARVFNVDRMDNVETAGLAFGKLAAEFLRTKVVPELDAYRFAKFAAKAGTKVVGNLADGQAAINAISKANTVLDEKEVDEEQRFLFITPTLYEAIMQLDTTKSKAALARFESANIIRVPQARFVTVIDLLSGKDGESKGGFKKNASGQDINFMIIHKPAVMQFTKNIVNKVISPDDNQDMDAWKFFFRANGLADVYDNKVDGIYVHAAE